MSSLMLINPRKRTGGRKKPRSAAQKAATKRMLAANRSRSGGSARPAKKRRKSNPVGLSRVTRARSTIARSRKRSVRRRNPINLPGIGNLGAMAMTSLQGAGGALLVNTALNYMPFLPVALSSGNGKYLARAGLAIAVGVFGGKVLPKRVAENMAVGAMTVALHDLLLGLASQAMPTMKLGDVGDYDDGVAAYLSGGVAGLNDMSAIYDVYDTAGNVGEYVS